MPLIKRARSAFLSAQARDVAVVRVDSVAVRLSRVCRLREGIAYRCIQFSEPTEGDLGLKPIVVAEAKISQHVHLPNASVNRQDRAGSVRRGNGSHLSRRRAV